MKAYPALKPQAHGIELGDLLFTLALGDPERFGPHPDIQVQGNTDKSWWLCGRTIIICRGSRTITAHESPS